MNLLKSGLAGAASAIGTHYADEAVNPVPHSQMVYYGVAAGGLLGAILLRNKSPIGAGLLLGLGAGSAYQGYTRTGAPTLGPQLAAPMPKVNPYSQFVTPTDVYPVRPPPAPVAPKATPPNIGGMTVEDVRSLAEQGNKVAQQIANSLGLDTSDLGSPMDFFP